MSDPNGKEAAPTTHAEGIAGRTAAELLEREQRIAKLLDQLDQEMEDAVELDDVSRGHSQRLRGQSEKDALASILDYVDTRPEAFRDLADRNEGRDPATFETALLRDRLEGALILSRIVDRVDASRLRLSDSALHLAGLVKPPVLAAYEIAKPLAALDKKHGQKLNGARNYYGGIARAGARTRKTKTEK